MSICVFDQGPSISVKPTEPDGTCLNPYTLTTDNVFLDLIGLIGATTTDMIIDAILVATMVLMFAAGFIAGQQR